MSGQPCAAGGRQWPRLQASSSSRLSSVYHPKEAASSRRWTDARLGGLRAGFQTLDFDLPLSFLPPGTQDACSGCSAVLGLCRPSRQKVTGALFWTVAQIAQKAVPLLHPAHPSGSQQGSESVVSQAERGGLCDLPVTMMTAASQDNEYLICPRDLSRR